MSAPLDSDIDTMDLLSYPQSQSDSDNISDIMSDDTFSVLQLQSDIDTLMKDLENPSPDQRLHEDSSQDTVAPAQNVNQCDNLFVMNNEQLEIPLETLSLPDISDDCSNSSVCSEGGIPTIVPWDGPYKFGYTIVVVGADKKQKRIYSQKLDKLFVMQSLETEFRFSYDSVNVKGSNMYLEAFLRYEAADGAKFPVERCMVHTEQERKALKKQNGVKENTEEELELIPHFLKCTHPRAEHFKDEYSRYRVRVPLGKPQVGTDHVSRNFKFDCLSSCKVDVPQKNKRNQKHSIVVVFQLKEKEEVRGRVVINLRVCFNPQRDCTNEENDLDNPTPKRRSCAKAPGTSGRRPAPGNEQDLERVAKQARLSDMTKPQLDLLTPKRSAGGSEDDPSLSSQESVLSDNGILPENNEKKARTTARSEPKPSSSMSGAELQAIPFLSSDESEFELGFLDDRIPPETAGASKVLFTKFKLMAENLFHFLANGGWENPYVREEIAIPLMSELRRAYRGANRYRYGHPKGCCPAGCTRISPPGILYGPDRKITVSNEMKIRINFKWSSEM